MRVEAERLKKKVKSYIGRAIFKTGTYRLPHYLSNVAVIIAFHRVNDITAGDGLTCNVQMFEQLCQFFGRYFRVVSLGHLIEKIEKQEPLNRELAITFDDGYRDNYEYAVPILKSMGLPGTFFVASKFIGTDHVPWWDRKLKVRQPWMSWEQVQSLHRDGFEIGAHTRTHADLGVASGERASEEIRGSRLDLENKLSAPVKLFAYPYGGKHQMTEENRNIVKAAGFRCCCSCFGGINAERTDPFLLQRIPISSWHIDPYHFGCDLAFRRI